MGGGGEGHRAIFAVLPKPQILEPGLAHSRLAGTRMSKSWQLQAVFSEVSRVGRAGPPHHPGTTTTHDRGVAEALDGLEDSTADDTHSEGSSAIVHNSPWAASRKGRAGLSEPLFPLPCCMDSFQLGEGKSLEWEAALQIILFPPSFQQEMVQKGKNISLGPSPRSQPRNQPTAFLLPKIQSTDTRGVGTFGSALWKRQFASTVIKAGRGRTPVSDNEHVRPNPALFPLFQPAPTGKNQEQTEGEDPARPQ